MAQVHGKDTVIFLGAYDLSAYFNDLSISQEVDLAETTTYGNESKTYLAGLRDGTASLSGLFDGDAGAADERLSAMFGNTSVCTFGIGGDAVGNKAKVLNGIQHSYEIGAPIGDAVTTSAEIQASGGIDNGLMLKAKGQVTTTGNGSSVDNGAATSNGYSANLHVFDGTNPGTGVVKVQHSTDNSVWADLVTFTTVGSAKTSERKTGTGTVNRYVRERHEMNSATMIDHAVAFARR
jgi:hypothetical protein